MPISALTARRIAWIAAATWGVSVGAVRAQPGQATLELQPPAALVEGDRADLTVLVHVPPQTREPLLLTPTSVGEAVTVVRGRLLRSDSEDPDSDPLIFRVPIVAAAPGNAVIRVRVQSFRCAERCRPVTLEGEVVVRVERRRVSSED